MEKIKIKNSDLEVSRLCIGGCPMGGYGWGKVSDDDLIDVINQAVEMGINFFDNADTYGLGKSEETLGKGLSNKRKDVVIGTKFGVRVENGKTFYDNSKEWINTALENSLRRLNTDYIDLYQVPYRDNVTPIGEVIETLKELQQKGYIRYFGLSNIHQKDVEELKDYKGEFVSFQDEYSLACRKNEEDMLDISSKLEMTPLTWGSLGQGILTGKYDEKAMFGKDDRRSRDIYVNFHGDKLLKNLEIVKELKAISEEINKPVPAIAMRWILDYLPNSIVLAGTKNPKQLKSNVECLGWELDKEFIDRLDKISK